MFAINVLNWFIEFLQSIFPQGFIVDFDLSPAVAQVSNIINFIAWVIPMDTVLFILGSSIFLIYFRIMVAIWKLLPLT